MTAELQMVHDCDVCRAYFNANGMQILESSASVGVEQSKPTRQVIQEYMIAFHNGGHNDD